MKELRLEEDMDRKTLFAFIEFPEESEVGKNWEYLWQEANCIGKTWFQKYWDISLSFSENLRNLDITKIRDMSIIEEKAWNARALYEPNDNEILINRYRLNEISELMKQTFDLRYKEKEIYNCLIAHEVFHHLEETKEETVTTILERKTGIHNIPAAFRDVGAHSFSNCVCALSGLKCQMLDIVWMEKNIRRIPI